MKRLLLTTVAALAAAAFSFALPQARDAAAVAPSQIVGLYKLRLKGEGWIRGTTEAYRSSRVGGPAMLTVTRPAVDATKMHVEIRLAPQLDGGILDLATPAVAFVGDGVLVGDSMAIIDTGAATYVNALTLTFQKDGDKLVGHWVASYPATDAAAGAASGMGVSFTGKRVGRDGKGNDDVDTPAVVASPAPAPKTAR
jgi:hypothetical protein